MKRLLPLLLATLVLFAGCGSGDSFNPSPELLAAAQCLGLSLEDLVDVYVGVLDLLGSIGGVIPPNMTYNIATGAYTITLGIGDLAGIVSSPNNLADGLGVGETATATWELNGGLAGAPTLTAEGSFTVARATATNFTVSGIGGSADGTCEFDFSSLNFAVNESVSAAPTGTIVFEATTPDGVLDGTMTFTNASPTVTRVVATFDGVSYTFFIDLLTFEPIF